MREGFQAASHQRWARVHGYRKAGAFNEGLFPLMSGDETVQLMIYETVSGHWEGRCVALSLVESGYLCLT